MPEYLAPGVYVEEIEMGGKPIEGVSTSTAGFLGETERGPAGVRFLTSFTQYEQSYGGYSWASTKGESKSFLPYALAGFFANGGKRCFVGRITSKAAKTATLSIAGKSSIGVSAVSAGEWGNRIGVSIRPVSSARPGKADPGFKLVVFYWSKPPPTPIIDPLDREKLKEPTRRDPAAQEVFDELSSDPESPNYFVRQINQLSHLIRVEAGPAPKKPAEGKAPDPVPSEITLLTGGTEGDALTLPDYEGSSSDDAPYGLAGLAEKEDISIVCIPNENDLAGLSDAVVTHCELLKDRIAVLQSKQDAGEVGDLVPPVTSKYAAFYYPWIRINDPATNLPRLIPPGGHVAGIYARSDTERGVHKAPANEAVRGALDLQFNLNKGEQEILNPRGVNCIRSFVGRGILLWGARTTSDDPLWKYVNVRRLFIFLEKSIERSTQWVVFEPNTERLWARVRQTINDFLLQVWKDGALMGLSPEQAYFVKCDRTTMTDNDIENGRLIVVVGVAPARPAEFVVFRLAQWRSGSALTE
ncbi:MAG TPA: phage tail sheath subtilisin-like domain-containing protein [Chthoniobacter sp.]|nr:phage tail sheath subtilisin-like domain-containing protein [Chthoniobacter sp.]